MQSGGTEIFMIRQEFAKKNYTATDYVFDDTVVRYILMNETKEMFLQLIPKSKIGCVYDNYYTVNFDESFPDHRDWFSGALVHLHISGDSKPSYSNGLKFSGSMKKVKFERQEYAISDDEVTISTYLLYENSLSVCHKLKSDQKGYCFEIRSTVKNLADEIKTIEAITSGSLDNLSPFCQNDSSDNTYLHFFKGGWAIEGKHITTKISDLSLEKSWGGSFENERFGSIGTKSTTRFFPYFAFEDRNNRTIWGVKLMHNATWQAELTRYGAKLSLSIGPGDESFGAWSKNLMPNESFEAPICLVSACEGDIADLSNRFVKAEMNYSRCKNDMSIFFNEWCSSWGKPSEESMLKLAWCLKGRSKTKYLIMDAGWNCAQTGDWDYSAKAFPGGLKAYTDKVRALGFIPGIWMEYECVAQGAKRFEDSYNHMYLTYKGKPLIGSINNSWPEKYLDLAKNETQEYLNIAVIEFLKNNGFGYLKIDYNSNAGIGCDGAESPGEGIRCHMQRVADFVNKIQNEIPDIMVENCASGGSRLDPFTVSNTYVSSFSDAHESFEIPVIAANLQYLIPPSKSQIWAVLRPEFTACRMKYIISAAFLGRLCWSGDFDKLTEEQWKWVEEAETMYENVSETIKNGFSRIYRTGEINCRHLRGSQAVLRHSEDESSLLCVYHNFKLPEKMEIKIGNAYRISKKLFEDGTYIEKGVLYTDDANSAFGNVILLEK